MARAVLFAFLGVRRKPYSTTRGATLLLPAIVFCGVAGLRESCLNVKKRGFYHTILGTSKYFSFLRCCYIPETARQLSPVELETREVLGPPAKKIIVA